MASSELLPVLLSLAAAALFGVSVLVARLGLWHSDPLTGSLASIASTALFYWALFPFFRSGIPWQDADLPLFLLVFAGIGLISPGVSLFLAFEGNQRAGPTVSGTVSSTSPIFATAGAVLVLGERASPGIAVGTLAIVAGVIALSSPGRGKVDWPLWVLVFPLGAALLRGVVTLGGKWGLGLLSAPFAASYLGALTTFTAAFLAVLLACNLRGLPLSREALRGGLTWFALTGVLNGVAVICMYGALASGPVVLVTPVVATFPLFTFALALLFRVERLSLSSFAGVLLVVVGVVGVIVW